MEHSKRPTRLMLSGSARSATDRVLHVPDALIDRPHGHLLRRVRREQPLECRLFNWLLVEPHCHASGGGITGIRLWTSAHSSFGVVVMIVKLRIVSWAEERQVSHNPASAMILRSASAMA